MYKPVQNVRPALGWRKRKISMFKFGCSACGEQWEIATPRTCKCPDYFSKSQPKKREWQGLTKKEVHDLFHPDFEVFHQRIEAKLKEKNT